MRFFLLFFLFLGLNSYSQDKVSFYFDFNKYTLNNDQHEKLEHWLKYHSESLILFMIGRADEKGSISYNDELSLKRVDEISKLIHNKVNYSKYFNKINLGEKFLSSHVDYENRRVDLYYIDHKFARYEDLIVNNINVETDLDKVKVDKSIEFKSHISAASLLDSINANPINTQFRLDLIHFEVDSEKLIPESKTELKKWIEVLKLNPKIKIIIQGHICCVPRDDYYLSTRRAKEVTKFFHDNGIEIDRMKYIGFGPTRPIYHIPERNGIEAKLNRRVEIIIVDK